MKTSPLPEIPGRGWSPDTKFYDNISNIYKNVQKDNKKFSAVLATEGFLLYF